MGGGEDGVYEFLPFHRVISEDVIRSLPDGQLEKAIGDIAGYNVKGTFESFNLDPKGYEAVYLTMNIEEAVREDGMYGLFFWDRLYLYGNLDMLFSSIEKVPGFYDKMNLPGVSEVFRSAIIEHGKEEEKRKLQKESYNESYCRIYFSDMTKKINLMSQKVSTERCRYIRNNIDLFVGDFRECFIS